MSAPLHHFNPRPPEARAARIALALGLAMLLSSARTYADFEILSGNTRITPGTIVTEAEVTLVLTDTVIEAINQGIEIRIVADLRLYRVRPWIWDQVIAEWQTGYRLKYHDLSSSYVLVDDSEGELETFATLRDALDSLADLRIALPVVTETLPENPYGYRASLRIDIDRDSLPPPLRLITEISPAWQLASRWRQWPVEQ